MIAESKQRQKVNNDVINNKKSSGAMYSCTWMDCGDIILWLPTELEDVQSADMSERGVWSMRGDTLGWIFLRYYNLLRLLVHIGGSFL